MKTIKNNWTSPWRRKIPKPDQEAFFRKNRGETKKIMRVYYHVRPSMRHKYHKEVLVVKPWRQFVRVKRKLSANYKY